MKFTNKFFIFLLVVTASLCVSAGFIETHLRWDKPSGEKHVRVKRAAIVMELTPTEQAYIVGRHNEIRSSATPTPANMNQMVWLTGLETVANNDVSMCKWVDSPQYFSGFTKVGENRFLFPGQLLTMTALELATSSWFAESTSYTHPNTDSCSGSCANYTQMIYSEATSIGCSVALCDTFDPALTTLVECFYGEGYTTGTSPYTAGAACTACTGHNCCLDNLCTAAECPTSTTVTTTTGPTVTTTTGPTTSTDPTTTTTTNPPTTTTTDYSTTTTPPVSSSTTTTAPSTTSTATSTTNTASTPTAGTTESSTPEPTSSDSPSTTPPDPTSTEASPTTTTTTPVPGTTTPPPTFFPVPTTTPTPTTMEDLSSTPPLEALIAIGTVCGAVTILFAAAIGIVVRGPSIGPTSVRSAVIRRPGIPRLPFRPRQFGNRPRFRLARRRMPNPSAGFY